MARRAALRVRLLRRHDPPGHELAAQSGRRSTPASQGAASYYAYSGDRRVVDFMRRVLDYQRVHGTTPSDPAWAWPAVPYARADPGAIRYRGAHDFRFADPKDPPKLGRGDGYGVIEPDKLGELGMGYLTVYVPKPVSAEGRALAPRGAGPGYSFDPKSRVLRVRRSAARTVTLTRSGG